MDPRNTEHVQVFEQSLLDWTDSRFLTRDQLRTVAMFTMYLVNLADHDGWSLDGYSWTERASLGCLVVKATIEGTPYVVFTSARTPINGMRIFLRKLDEGLLNWVPDKYRQ